MVIKVVNQEEKDALKEVLVHCYQDVWSVTELYETDWEGMEQLESVKAYLGDLIDSIEIADTKNLIGEIQALIKAGASDTDIAKELMIHEVTVRKARKFRT